MPSYSDIQMMKIRRTLSPRADVHRYGWISCAGGKGIPAYNPEDEELGYTDYWVHNEGGSQFMARATPDQEKWEAIVKEERISGWWNQPPIEEIPVDIDSRILRIKTPGMRSNIFTGIKVHMPYGFSEFYARHYMEREENGGFTSWPSRMYVAARNAVVGVRLPEPKQWYVLNPTHETLFRVILCEPDGKEHEYSGIIPREWLQTTHYSVRTVILITPKG
jgi:hypothetical protein